MTATRVACRKCGGKVYHGHKIIHDHSCSERKREAQERRQAAAEGGASR